MPKTKPLLGAYQFSLLPQRLAVCRFDPAVPVPDWATRGRFVSVTRTSAELSIVCDDDLVPSGVKCQHGYVGLELCGPFLLADVGVLRSFIAPLSDHGIPIFVVSTHDTDYILLLTEYWEMALAALTEAGHELVPLVNRSEVGI